MGRRSLLSGAAATLAAGVALWFTRASLDVFPADGGVTRAAMLPAVAELVGLVVLAALTAFLLRAAVARLGGPQRDGHARAPALGPLVAPALSLAWLAVPYAPWLADLVPAWRALAGPAAIGLWLVVGGQVAWLSWDAVRERWSRGAASPAGRGATVLVFTAGALIFALAGHRLAAGALYPGGDEPHYLVITQSLLRDGDLRIDDNHARGDYQAYYAGTLAPDVIVKGRNDAVYSIHPIGLPVLAAPAFAIGGYPGVMAFLVIVAAWAAARMWRWAAEVSGSASAATLAWMAVALSTPFVLHSIAVYPEVVAAACVMAALARLPAGTEPRVLAFGGRAAAVALLPWLGTKYAPMALVAVLLLAWRARRHRAAVAAILGVWTLSIAGWLIFFQALWGSPWPSAPYGDAHQMAAVNLLTGGPALFVDQEYGVLVYAPALLLALPGLWLLWKDGGERREAAVGIVLVLAALVGTVGTYFMWWGGSSAPGRQVVAGLLLLGLPIARWAAHVAAMPARRALGRVLALVGMVVTATLVWAREGLLIANRRDGRGELLEWLEPGHELVRLAPSAIAFRDEPLTYALSIVLWAGVAALVAWLVRRARPSTGGHAAAVATSALIAGASVGAMLVPIVLGARLPEPLQPELRAQVPLLEDYDARRRPVAVIYDPWRRVDAASLPERFILAATPGARRQPQPVRVLLHMRLALPAGEYAVAITPGSGQALRGVVALQVGRVGAPLHEWTVDEPAGTPWRARVVLPVDATFVGFRTTPEFEQAVASARVEPVRVVDASDRPRLPTVLSAGAYGDAIVTFHGDAVYPEPGGFWVRGRSTLQAAFSVPGDPDRLPGVRLTVHSGAAPTRVRIATAGWSQELALEPKVAQHVEVPALPGQTLLPVRFSTASGFVPADHGGGSDRRLLGCWVEVMP